MYAPPDQRLSFEQYAQAAEALHNLSGILLFEFARETENQSASDRIAGNLIGRASVMVRGIFSLWQIKDYVDCWILHRAMLDRLFHLHDLNQKKQFDVFSDWSFKQLYEAALNLRSDPDLKGQLNGLVEDPTPAQKERYRTLSKNPPGWRRSKSEDIAKQMDLKFLYRYGYDYASRFVHPMANDGQDDFYSVTGVPAPYNMPEANIVVLSNSILIASMILQEALNASSLSWRAVVYDAIDGVRNFLKAADIEQHLPLVKVVNMFTEKTSISQRL